MLTISCVLSDGPKRNYNPSHVKRLMRQVEGRLSQPYRFVCLTNYDVPCERLRLVNDWPGWWSKIELFTPGLFKSGSKNRVLYLDLDVDITGTLDDLADSPAPFVLCPDWIPTRRKDGSLRHSRFNSSVMTWDAGIADHIYEKFSPDVMERLEGDEDWIGEVMPEATLFKLGSVVSYKANVKPRGGVPPNAKVVVYHGDPKPWDLQ